MHKLNKKGFSGGLGGLFNSVLMIVMVTIIVGLAVIVLGNMGAITGLDDGAYRSLGNASTAIGTVSTTWTAIIVLVIVVGLLITILLASFAGRGKQ